MKFSRTVCGNFISYSLIQSILTKLSSCLNILLCGIVRCMRDLIYFIETSVFTKRVDDLGNEILYAIQDDLLKDPQRGATVAGTGGARKARTADPGRGKGKRSGVRYMYVYFQETQTIYLLFLYGKDEQDDLTKEQKKIVEKLVDKARANIKERYG